MTDSDSPSSIKTRRHCVCDEGTSDDGTNDDETTMRHLVGPSASSRGENECCLVQIYPPDMVSGMTLLVDERVVIGRDSSADLLLEDTSVSRQHAELVKQPNGYLIRDLGSTNGTVVNEQKVKEQKLCSGDTIKLGAFIYKFLSAGSVESKYHETVYSAMTRDALTGAMNKRYLLESLRREVARAIRQQQPISVVMVDVDHFKSVNDRFGHLIGDEVLKEFGSRMAIGCREDDLLARYGGEEFCLVLGLTGHHEALEIADRSRRMICDLPFQTSAGELNVTASFGVACLEVGEVKNPDSLIGLADKFLYEAKRSGRNCVAG